jgi:C_GCAxxG_C_C family probable redox protein
MENPEKALNYFDNKFNCAQSVLVTFAEQLGLSEDEALRVACAFGGGMGRQQLTCGAVTGAAMALGLAFGKAKEDPEEKKLHTYDMTVELFEEFEKLHGSVECFKLLNNLDMKIEKDHSAILEQNLFHINCRKYVSDAVSITEKIIKDNK